MINPSKFLGSHMDTGPPVPLLTDPNVALVSPDFTDSTSVAAKTGGPSVDTAASLGFVPRVQGTMLWPYFKTKAPDVIPILYDKDD
jgi:hypothetical protein